MKTSSQWIEELAFEIYRLQMNRRKTYYGFSLKMDKQTANDIKRHFSNAGYSVEATVCPRGLWDLIITF